MPMMVLGSAVDALCMVCVQRSGRSFSFVCFLSLSVRASESRVCTDYRELVACLALQTLRGHPRGGTYL